MSRLKPANRVLKKGERAVAILSSLRDYPVFIGLFPRIEVLG